MGADNDRDFNDANRRPPDRTERAAVEELRAFFTENRQVFCSRQIEVNFERKYFHWITARALKVLAAEGIVRREERTLSYGAPVFFVWHKSNRYNRREIVEILSLIERYSHPDFTAALGNTGELLVSDGFSRFGFVQRGRNARQHGEFRWTESEHNLDFLFERDGRVYGVEVKNTLPYIDDKEFLLKQRLCLALGVIPVFVVRSMPTIWVQDLNRMGGFALILGHQLYPLSHRAFAVEVKERMGLPVDAPRSLYDGTMLRFVSWHERAV